jgi:putative transposase
MKLLRLKYPLALLCQVLEMSRSGYYAWLARPLSKRAQDEERLEIEIKAAHKRTRQTCGPERLQSDLAARGVKVGISRIRRIRKKLGIRCKQVKKFKATTDSRHALPVAENLLEQQFSATAPNQVWVSDLTYIPTEEGWLYCAAHKDLFNGEIVGYALGTRITTHLVEQSLLKAVRVKRPPQGLIHHSDRGSQYASADYRHRLDEHGIICSMSRRANCWDNAVAESFFATLKTELVYGSAWTTRAEARAAIFEYVEGFYNARRRHSSLGYLSPVAFEQQYEQKSETP